MYVCTGFAVQRPRDGIPTAVGGGRVDADDGVVDEAHPEREVALELGRRVLAREHDQDELGRRRRQGHVPINHK